ncbi:ATP-binding protein [Streptomyces sp. cg28]|uniref:ATP-binding protein n=1 Tax=Streptomyces sp. cg28 TaxID=3403457 RepID=UPI003B214E09
MTGPHPPQPTRIDLLATPKAVPELRHRLRGHGFEVQLCVSELVTNVIDHLGEGTPVTVLVRDEGDGRTRIEVTDPDPRALPVLLHAVPDDESGRGLALVGAVALRWGVRQGTYDKTVWCEVAEDHDRPGQKTAGLTTRATTS